MEQQLLGTPGVLLLTFIGTECKSRRWKHAVSAVWHCIYCAASYGNASRLQRGACHQEAQTGKPPFLKVVSTLLHLFLLFFFPTLNFWRERRRSNNQCWNEKRKLQWTRNFPSFANVWFELEIIKEKPETCSWSTCSRTHPRPAFALWKEMLMFSSWSILYSFRAPVRPRWPPPPPSPHWAARGGRANTQEVARYALTPRHTKNHA